jgi:hypothetical protein
MPEIGDRVRMHAVKVDQAPREGVVTSVNGALLRISGQAISADCS